MSTAPSASGRPFTLVVGVDLTDTESSGYAFDQAARVALRIPGSQLHVVHAMHERDSHGRARDTAGLLVMYVEEKAVALGGMERQSVGVHLRAGDAATCIAQLAIDLGADMILVGSHHAPRLKNLVVGSTAERLMAIASCPVVVAGPRPRPEPSHVIVIEPPCGDCLDARAATHGKTWWCARHSESHHLRRHHLYSFTSQLPFGEHDSEVSATGADA
jgi:nucleotide-binding universal stress UspA family protein